MLENGIQLTPASTSNSTGKTRNNGKELNGSASTEEEKRQGNGGDVQPPPPSTCTTCAKGHTCQAVVSRTREMRSLIDAKKPHQAQALFDDLADEGHRPSLVTYTTLLTAVTNQRAFEAIPSLLAGIDAAGLRPDAIFFNALINSFVEAGRMGEATSTFWKMSRHHPGCRPTISTFNTLIKGFGIAGRPDEAQRVFDMMAGGDGHGDGAGVASTVRPNLTTYNILVKAWCDHRRLEEAWGVVGRMRARGVEPDVVTYNTVASAYAKNDETWRAEELVVEMVRARLRTSERTWGIIVGGYCREGRLEEALRCVRQMKDAGVLPNVIVFNTLLKGFLDANDTAAADDVRSRADGAVRHQAGHRDVQPPAERLQLAGSHGEMQQGVRQDGGGRDRAGPAGVQHPRQGPRARAAARQGGGAPGADVPPRRPPQRRHLHHRHQRLVQRRRHGQRHQGVQEDAGRRRAPQPQDVRDAHLGVQRAEAAVEGRGGPPDDAGGGPQAEAEHLQPRRRCVEGRRPGQECQPQPRFSR
ncbi:pentatricopeptide repeat-containing protein At5g25630-like isoform X2 [Triticum dicoccoides]|uniref:pentatricopeptide repeat-containing protein At5g25630-like isoform X2 n=1 Tax=Triticum dicoccoides TaxID=85692 RepID=UPI00084447D9|nr:pentatricopeptide repeat-containing protein At5g25630-like isoform X2 [Triticum dicoccoides]